MQAGRLRDRVTILNVTTARSPSGHPVETVTEGATVWAEVKGISGRERISGGAETAQATVRVWMRFRRDVTAASRLKVRKRKLTAVCSHQTRIGNLDAHLI